MSVRTIEVDEIITPPGWSLSLGIGRDERTGQRVTFYAGLDEVADVRAALEARAHPVIILVPDFYLIEAVMEEAPMVPD